MPRSHPISAKSTRQRINDSSQWLELFSARSIKKLFYCMYCGMCQTLAFAATNENEDSFFIIGGYNCSSRTHKISTSTTRIEVNVVEPTTMSEEKNSLTAIRVKSSIFNSCWLEFTWDMDPWVREVWLCSGKGTACTWSGFDHGWLNQPQV